MVLIAGMGSAATAVTLDSTEDLTTQSVEPDGLTVEPTDSPTSEPQAVSSAPADDYSADSDTSSLERSVAPADAFEPKKSDLKEALEGEIVGPEEALRGEEIEVEFPGLTPGTEVSFWMFSEPTDLGTEEVDDDGVATVTIPKDVPLGSHTLAAYDEEQAQLGWTGLDVVTEKSPAAEDPTSIPEAPTTSDDEPTAEPTEGPKGEPTDDSAGTTREPTTDSSEDSFNATVEDGLGAAVIGPRAAGADGPGLTAPYVYWEAKAESGALLGGASFRLQGPRSGVFNVSWGNAVVVEDNIGQPGYSGLDMDPDPGEFAVMYIGSHRISDSSVYRVQRVSAPPNHYTGSTDWREIPGQLLSPNSPKSGAWSSRSYDFGSFEFAPFTNIRCEPNYSYSVLGGGALRQIVRTPNGTNNAIVTTVGSWSGQSDVNALAIGANGSVVYAIDRTGNGGQNVRRILQYTPSTGVWEEARSTTFTTGNTGSIVAGAVNLSNDRFLFGAFHASASNPNNLVFRIHEFNPTNGEIRLLGYINTGLPSTTTGSNGDMAFDAAGNLYIVRGTAGTTTGTAQIFSVTAASLVAASSSPGGLIPHSATPQMNTAMTAGVNGIAFESDGTVYLSDTTRAERYDPTTWTRVQQVSTSLNTSSQDSGLSTDLGSCVSPATLVLQKDVAGRVGQNDQFRVSVRSGTTEAAFAVTAGTESGIQPQQAGPIPVVAGNTYTIAETMANGQAIPSTYVSSYVCTADDGSTVASGTGTSGNVTVPARPGAVVECVFRNATLVADVTIRKQVQDASGENAVPAAGWTVNSERASGSTAVTRTPNSAQQTASDEGKADWRFQFQDVNQRIGLTISETMQSGYAFVSGTCAVGKPDGTEYEVELTSVSQAIPNIGAGDRVDCTYVNKQVPPGPIMCTPDSPYIVNQLSQGTIGSPYTNKLQNYNVTNGQVTDLVNLSSTVTRETNGLGISSDGRYFYFIDFHISGTRTSGGQTVTAPLDPKIYRYDATNGLITTYDAAKGATPNDNGQVRRGGVNLANDVYYYSTTQGDSTSTVHNLYALNPSGESWYVGTVTTPGAAGQSGDLAFDNLGNMYFVTGSISNAHVSVYDGRDLPVTPNSTPINITTKYLNSTSGDTGNGVGVAYGLDGYLYTSNTGANVYKLDPSNGNTVGSVMTIPQDGGNSATSGRSVDLATCVSPSTLTLKKDLPTGRVDAGDQFTLSAWRNTSTAVGQAVTTNGPVTGVQTSYLGPVPILTGAGNSYTIREVAGSGRNLNSYGTSYECIDTQDSNWGGASGTITTTGAQRQFDLGIIPAGTGTKSRAIECTFTNQGTKVIVNKTVQNSQGGDEAPGVGWTVNAAPSAPVTPTPSNSQPTDADGSASWFFAGFTSAVQTTTVGVSETQKPGYEFVSGSCTVTPLVGEPRTVTLNGEAAQGVPNVSPGDQVECTYVNKVRPATVTLNKSVQDFDGQNPDGAAGWTVGAALQTPPTGVEITTPATQVTGDTGAAPNAWRIDYPHWASTATMPITGVTVHEDLASQTGYSFVGGVCEITRPDEASPISVEFTGNPETTLSGATNAIRPGDVVDCTFTNRPLTGSVTWEKVDENGDPLAHSVWSIVGTEPEVVAIEVPDCVELTEEACASQPDKDHNAGKFRVEGLAWGDYELSETKAPAGYVIAPGGPHEFTIAADNLTYEFGEPFVNTPRDMPNLPLTGGLGRDFFFIAGGGVLLLGFGAVVAAQIRNRRREVA